VVNPVLQNLLTALSCSER